MILEVTKSAEISPCGTYRFLLQRIWSNDLPILVVCMLNPSTADATVDDPTILRLMDFAASWGFGGIKVVNVRAFRSSNPINLILNPATGDELEMNEAFIEAQIIYAKHTSGVALAAWGNGARNWNFFSAMAEVHKVQLVCLGTTLSGHPKHPLARGKHRIPRGQQYASFKVVQP